MALQLQGRWDCASNRPDAAPLFGPIVEIRVMPAWLRLIRKFRLLPSRKCRLRNGVLPSAAGLAGMRGPHIISCGQQTVGVGDSFPGTADQHIRPAALPRGCSSVVEHHVANVDVEGSNPFTRFFSFIEGQQSCPSRGTSPKMVGWHWRLGRQCPCGCHWRLCRQCLRRAFQRPTGGQAASATRKRTLAIILN